MGISRQFHLGSRTQWIQLHSSIYKTWGFVFVHQKKTNITDYMQYYNNIMTRVWYLIFGLPLSFLLRWTLHLHSSSAAAATYWHRYLLVLTALRVWKQNTIAINLRCILSWGKLLVKLSNTNHKQRMSSTCATNTGIESVLYVSLDYDIQHECIKVLLQHIQFVQQAFSNPLVLWTTDFNIYLYKCISKVSCTVVPSLTEFVRYSSPSDK